MYSLRQHKEQHRADGDKYDQREHEILLDTTGLHDTQFEARPIGGIRCAITKETIDDWQIEVIADRIANSLSARTEKMQDTIKYSLIEEFIHDIFREPVSR